VRRKTKHSRHRDTSSNGHVWKTSSIRLTLPLAIHPPADEKMTIPLDFGVADRRLKRTSHKVLGPLLEDFTSSVWKTIFEPVDGSGNGA
jgi:hypothetical protein